MAKRGKKTVIAKTLVGITLTPSERQLACLVQFSGDNIGRPFFLRRRETTIGRDPRAIIPVNEPQVSRLHAVVFRADRYVSVEDMNSSNGVYVNGRKIQGITKLKDGDMLGVGSATFKFFRAGNAEQLFYDRLYRAATIDEKTKVFNAKYFRAALETEIDNSLAFGHPLALLLYDLDFFKKVNDKFGHVAGDAVLAGTAQVASQVVRKNDILCRYGGEEFAIILRETDHHTACQLALRLGQTIARTPFKIRTGRKQVTLQQTISIGVAQLQKRNASPKKLVEAADKKLYAAKRKGRNCVVG